MTHKKMGLIACTAVVAGNMMGSGVAMLPSTLAAIGSVSVYSWVLAILGALGLAYVFARLGIDDPQEGGPVAYANSVSPIFGFQAQTLYFHANWIGNVAIGVTSVSYLAHVIPKLQDPFITGAIVVAEIWLLIILNLMGAHWIGRLASVGVIFVIVPVAATAIFGWGQFDYKTFLTNWNASNTPDPQAIMSGVLLCIWSFIGVESAAVDMAVVDNPKRNIPLSTVGGTLIASVLYILSCTVFFGLFSNDAVANASAPFSMAVAQIFHLPALGSIVAILIAAACFCNFGSWILLVALAGVRAAKDGNLPKVFSTTNKSGVPAKGLLIIGVLMTVLMLILTFYHQNSQKVFGELISIAVLLTVLPYYYSALYLIQRTEHTKRGAVRFIASALAILFCFASFFGGSAGALIGMVVVAFGILVFYAEQHPMVKKTTNKIKGGK